MSVSNRFRRLGRLLRALVRDLGPLVAVVFVFQALVLQQPMPQLPRLLTGLVCVGFGLLLFVRGLQIGLFPLGETMAAAFTRKGSVFALLAFAFLLGFSTTVAEPALIAVAEEAARTAAALRGTTDEQAIAGQALRLRLWVAVAVGTALVIGVLRTIKGWPVHRLILGGYALVLGLAPFAPAGIVGIAFDSGGVTTSTVTVPLVTALGVGLASSIRGRTPLVDGFGMIALASLVPILFLLLLGAAGLIDGGG
ncbi:MAG: DUF1538 domain-containing protein [Rhodospirillales bacterium]